MQIDDRKEQVRSYRVVAERAKSILNGEKQVEEAHHHYYTGQIKVPPFVEIGGEVEH